MKSRSCLRGRCCLCLTRSKYEVTQVGITKDGRWFTGADAIDALENGKTDGLEHVILSPDPSEQGPVCVARLQYVKLTDIDVFFPVMHGTYSEDGTMQGLLEMADVAYVGAGVVGAAVGMDKGIFKDVMVANDIPVVDTIVVQRREIEQDMESVIRKAEEMCDLSALHQTSQYGLFRRCDQVQQSLRSTGRVVRSRGLRPARTRPAWHQKCARDRSQRIGK